MGHSQILHSWTKPCVCTSEIPNFWWSNPPKPHVCCWSLNPLWFWTWPAHLRSSQFLRGTSPHSSAVSCSSWWCDRWRRRGSQDPQEFSATSWCSPSASTQLADVHSDLIKTAAAAAAAADDDDDDDDAGDDDDDDDDDYDDDDDDDDDDDLRLLLLVLILLLVVLLLLLLLLCFLLLLLSSITIIIITTIISIITRILSSTKTRNVIP